MKTLSKETVSVIKNVIDTGKIFNVDVFIIDKTGIRARSNESYIYLAQKEDYGFLEFGSLCVNKITEFNKRLSFMESISGKEGFDIELSGVKELDSGDTFVSKLQLVTSGTAVEIGGVNGSRYSLPWGIDDENLVSFDIEHNNIEVLSGFSRAVQNKKKSINIKGIDGIIVASSSDNEGDTATHILSSDSKFYNGTRDFSFLYNIGNLTPMMRGRLNMAFTLTERGILLTELNGINIIIFPEKISN
jgi:hypothetical protein